MRALDSFDLFCFLPEDASVEGVVVRKADLGWGSSRVKTRGFTGEGKEVRGNPLAESGTCVRTASSQALGDGIGLCCCFLSSISFSSFAALSSCSSPWGLAELFLEAVQKFFVGQQQGKELQEAVKEHLEKLAETERAAEEKHNRHRLEAKQQGSTKYVRGSRCPGALSRSLMTACLHD